MTAELDGLRDRIGIPTRGNTRGEQRLHFGREIQRLIAKRIEQRLDAEAIARREQRAMLVIPNDERELAAQPMQALRAEILIEMKRDLAVRARAQFMSRLFQLALNRLVTVEL